MHYYSFNSGPTVVDELNKSDARATSGNVQFNAGKAGNALQMGGTSADYVDIGSWSMEGTFSVSAWALFTRVSADDPRIISKATGPDVHDHS